MEDMKNRRNYYRVLHVQPDAPRDVIRSSYRTMMQRLRMHPDLGGDDKHAAVINEAYATLTDPGNRAAYDKTRENPERTTGVTPAADGAAHRQSAPLHVCAFCGAAHGYCETIPAGACCGNCQSPLSLVPQVQMEDRGRRGILRIPRNQPLIFYTHWPQREPCEGRTDDISLNGMKFHSNSPLELGQILKLDSQILKAVASVTYCQQEQKGWVVGVQFISQCFQQSRGSFITEQA